MARGAEQQSRLPLGHAGRRRGGGSRTPARVVGERRRPTPPTSIESSSSSENGFTQSTLAVSRLDVTDFRQPGAWNRTRLAPWQPPPHQPHAARTPPQGSPQLHPPRPATGAGLTRTPAPVNKLGVAAVAVTVVLWASAFVGIRAVGPSFSPGSLTLGRLAIAAVVLGAVVLPKLRELPRGREWWPILAYGVMWFGGYNVALNAAEHLLDAGTTALLINVNPILVAVMAGVILKEGFPRWLIIGSLVAFGGVAVIALGFRAAVDGGRGRRAALPPRRCARRRQRHHPEAGAAEVPRGAGHLVRHHGGRRVLPALQRPAGDRTAGGAAAGHAGPGVPRRLPHRHRVHHLGLCAVPDRRRKLAATTYLVPGTTILISWLVLSEIPTVWGLVGGAICLVGVGLTRRRSRAHELAAMPANLPPGLPIIPDGPDDGGPGDSLAPFAMSEAEFEAAVSDALDRIPAELARAMDNVAVFIEDDYMPQPGEDPDTVLLGLYEGVPLTERDSWWDAGSLPDRITILPPAHPGHLRLPRGRGRGSRRDGGPRDRPPLRHRRRRGCTSSAGTSLVGMGHDHSHSHGITATGGTASG